jgi:hypothetical protein
MRVEEEKIIQKQYPLDYQRLILKLKERYKNFIVNDKFHNLKRELMKNPRFCRISCLFSQAAIFAEVPFWTVRYAFRVSNLSKMEYIEKRPPGFKNRFSKKALKGSPK